MRRREESSPDSTESSWPYPARDESYTDSRWTAMKHGFSIRYAPEHGRPKQVRYAPRPDDPGWVRVVCRWTGSQWEPEGCQVVYGVAFAESTTDGGDDTGE